MVDYQDLLYKPYREEVNDCFQLCRRYYAKLGIEIKDYAFPSDFWEYEDLYSKHFKEEGFVGVSTDDWKPQEHDVLLVRGSSMIQFPTHAGIMVDPNSIIHHYTGRLSEKVAFKGIWRNPAIVLRHKDVKIEKLVEPEIDILELMPSHVRRKFENLT